MTHVEHAVTPRFENDSYRGHCSCGWISACFQRLEAVGHAAGSHLREVSTAHGRLETVGPEMKLVSSPTGVITILGASEASAATTFIFDGSWMRPIGWLTPRRDGSFIAYLVIGGDVSGAESPARPIRVRDWTQAQQLLTFMAP